MQIVTMVQAWASKVRAGKGSKGDRLGIVDHSTINYPPFRKNFYIEVCCHLDHASGCHPPAFGTLRALHCNSPMLCAELGQCRLCLTFSAKPWGRQLLPCAHLPHCNKSRAGHRTNASLNILWQQAFSAHISLQHCLQQPVLVDCALSFVQLPVSRHRPAYAVSGKCGIQHMHTQCMQSA